MFTHKRFRAFTLIELLVVIAIIALLMAILVPSLQAVKEQAAAVVCGSNSRGLGQAWHTYATSNDGDIVDAHVPRNMNAPYTQYPNRVTPPLFYEAPRAFWVNPPHDGNMVYTGDDTPVLEQDELRGIRSGLLWDYADDLGVYRCPSTKSQTGNQGYRSYSINAIMNAAEMSWKIAWDGDVFTVKVNSIGQIRRPSEKMVFLEDADNRNWIMGAWWPPLNDGNHDQWNDPLAVWHGDNGTLTFADGHVEKHKWVDKSTIVMSETSAGGTIIDRAGGEGADIEYMRKICQPKTNLK